MTEKESNKLVTEKLRIIRMFNLSQKDTIKMDETNFDYAAESQQVITTEGPAKEEESGALLFEYLVDDNIGAEQFEELLKLLIE